MLLLLSLLYYEEKCQRFVPYLGGDFVYVFLQFEIQKELPKLQVACQLDNCLHQKIAQKNNDQDNNHR